MVQKDRKKNCLQEGVVRKKLFTEVHRLKKKVCRERFFIPPPLQKNNGPSLSTVAQQKIDCLCILPTGFGKSLIFQLVPFVVDHLDKVNNSCVLVVSPLNAIISDQIEKLKARGVGVQIFKQGSQEIIPSIDETVKFV